MKRIIATTALALMLGTSVHAANDNGAMLKAYTSEQPGDIYASNFIGMRVYAADNEWDAWDENARVAPDAEKEWDDIGEVNDVILGKNGEVKAVILGVGGFVGLGEKDVAVTMDQIKMVREDGDTDDYFLVVKTNKESLTEMQAYERTDTMQAGTDDTQALTDTGQADSEQTGGDAKQARIDAEQADTDTTKTGSVEPVAMDRPMLTRPEVTREGYLEAEPVELTAEKLEGARVYGANDEDIGEINRLILSEDGKVEKVVIDVGGFLGMGEHPVAVTFDEIQVLRTQDGRDFRVYIDSSEEALEEQPAYKG